MQGVKINEAEGIGTGEAWLYIFVSVLLSMYIQCVYVYTKLSLTNYNVYQYILRCSKYV